MSARFKVLAVLAATAAAAACVWVGHDHRVDELISEAIAKEARAERLSAYVAIHTQHTSYYPCEVVVVQSLPSGRDAKYGCYSRRDK